LKIKDIIAPRADPLLFFRGVILKAAVTIWPATKTQQHVSIDHDSTCLLKEQSARKHPLLCG
jgi:hypothetical protein